MKRNLIATVVLGVIGVIACSLVNRLTKSGARTGKEEQA
jgi:hypothetical protein